MGTKVNDFNTTIKRQTGGAIIGDVPPSPCALLDSGSVAFDTNEINESSVVHPRSGTLADITQKFAGLGVGIVSVLSEHVLSHPFIVIRRQCQVQHDSYWFHLTPLTLIQPIYNIQRHQGFGALWKGIGSSLLVKCMGVTTETAISEITGLPREINRHDKFKKMSQHVLLKTLSLVAVTPFYAASLVETVQSDIASECPGLFDWVREGSNRLFATSSVTRLLPIWQLYPPMVLHGILHYALSAFTRYTVRISLQRGSKLHPSKSSTNTVPSPMDSAMEQYSEMVANLTGALLADLALYPLQTILHRLCIQGTRTIIDNIDTGLGVVPIITRYEGAFDCLKSILTEEGVCGLYKGLGVLVLQYGMQIAILRTTRIIVEALTQEDLPPDFDSTLSPRHDKHTNNPVLGHSHSLGTHLEARGATPGSPQGAYDTRHYSLQRTVDDNPVQHRMRGAPYTQHTPTQQSQSWAQAWDPYR